MFEKEAEEYFETECLHSYADTEEQLKEDVVPAFQKGAEFGYNKAKEEYVTELKEVVETCNHWQEVAEKANEWLYVKDKLPPSGETVLLYYGTNIMGKAVMSTGYVDCKGNWYKNVDGEPIKWQEIVLPKEIKEK